LLYSIRHIPLRLDVLRRLEAARDKRTALTRLIPLSWDDPISSTITLSGLVVVLINLLVSGKVTWGFIPVVVNILQEKLRSKSLLPEITDLKNSGVSPVFYLCYGTKRPTKEQIKELKGHLLQGLHDEIG
jgi:hypothetical protein